MDPDDILLLLLILVSVGNAVVSLLQFLHFAGMF